MKRKIKKMILFACLSGTSRIIAFGLSAISHTLARSAQESCCSSLHFSWGMDELWYHCINHINLDFLSFLFFGLCFEREKNYNAINLRLVGNVSSVPVSY